MQKGLIIEVIPTDLQTYLLHILLQIVNQQFSFCKKLLDFQSLRLVRCNKNPAGRRNQEILKCMVHRFIETNLSKLPALSLSFPCQSATLFLNGFEM